jgi:hypothetical protein
MTLHAHLKNNEDIVIRPQATIIPLRINSAGSIEQHGKGATGKAKNRIPLFYSRPIFKAKKHDPL